MSLLTKTEGRRIAMCAELSTGKTISQVAAEFGVSDSCVNSASKWYRANRLYNFTASQKVEHAKQALEKRHAWLEKQRRLWERKCKQSDEGEGRQPVPIGFANTYLREGREIIMAIAELDGVYKRTLNIDINAEVTHHIDYSQYTDEDLKQLQRLREKANVHGDN